MESITGPSLDFGGLHLSLSNIEIDYLGIITFFEFHSEIWLMIKQVSLTRWGEVLQNIESNSQNMGSKMAQINEIDRPTDAVFLLFYYAKEIRGVTKVQKLLFLMEQETEFGKIYGKNISLEFKAYKMGPFSPGVYDEIDLLRTMGAIKVEEMEKDASDSYEFEKWNELFKASEGDSEGLANKIFIVTDKGEKIGESLEKLLDEFVSRDLENKIDRYNSMTLMQLLNYVYTNYERMTERSEIFDEVMKY